MSEQAKKLPDSGSMPDESSTELVVALLVLALSGCAVQDNPSPKDTATTSAKMAYFKDAHGICYAEIKSYSYGFNQIASIATVPCEKVGL